MLTSILLLITFNCTATTDPCADDLLLPLQIQRQSDYRRVCKGSNKSSAQGSVVAVQLKVIRRSIDVSITKAPI
jgi:hypothetical protein